jgi:hypothetical protein
MFINKLILGTASLAHQSDATLLEINFGVRGAKPESKIYDLKNSDVTQKASINRMCRVIQNDCPGFNNLSYTINFR